MCTEPIIQDNDKYEKSPMPAPDSRYK